MFGYFLLFTLAACRFPSGGHDSCLEITGQSPCAKTSGCKWYGRLNNGGACVTEHGHNDPKADTCKDYDTQSACDQHQSFEGCKWYGKKTGNHPKCVTKDSITDPKAENYNVAKNAPAGGFWSWFR